ncbi:MAG: hypothetical protein KJO81_11485 [Gammaproteobacteria bacterium]|nr:hypothetical protein [Gammaproteobacteria bacterium]NNC68092.1 hypothetical protein [Gammaproteobacteria bacterium]
MENIKVPISPGELLDKITILEIKSENIEDKKKLANIETELKLLSQIWGNTNPDSDLEALKQELKDNNKALWEIEDKIRIKESNKEFDHIFVELARSVYIQNDKRADTKKKINLKLGSMIVEEKSYADY